MTIEASLAALAESNLTLAAAMNNYAAVMTKYAGITVSNVASAPGDAAPAAAEPTKGKRRTKAEIAADEAAAKAAAASPAAEDADPFAEDEPTKEYTLEDVRAHVMALSKQDREAALGVLKKVGAETISKIEPKSFEKVIELCQDQGISL